MISKKKELNLLILNWDNERVSSMTYGAIGSITRRIPIIYAIMQ